MYPIAAEAVMATTSAVSLPAIPIGEYLGSVYRPDVDYVDGVLEERNVGEFDHADVQKAVLLALAAQERGAGVRAMQELRVQVSEHRFRLPDVCLLPLGLRTPVIRQAPLLCAEVLSPRDSIMRMRHRCEDYLSMGVPEVWIFNPETRSLFVLKPGSMHERRDGTLILEGTSIRLEITDIFSVLDQE
jgi:Uma2 family endonuclease